jgi:hypothetical protein
VQIRLVSRFSINGPNPTDASDDILTALDQWVEYQNAPDKFLATKYVSNDPTQGIAFQRPLLFIPANRKIQRVWQHDERGKLCVRETRS